MLFKKKEIQTPRHVAFICDGNRRWARLRGKAATYGYKIGADIVDKSAEFFIGRGVSTVSYFLFSTENWGRDPKEVKYLMDLMEAELQQHADRAHEKNIRVQIIGRRDRFNNKIIKMFEKIEKQTAGNTAGTIVMALDYGGQDEIIRAAQTYAESVGAHTCAPSRQSRDYKGRKTTPRDESRGDPGYAPLHPEDFESFMDTGKLPPIDLVVRSSAEQRISNFMLWKLAYAELLFYPKYWPALTDRDFEKMLKEYGKRKRKFGV